MNLTQLCHQKILDYKKQWSYSIDATCGNGFDTQFLLEHTEETGKVFAFDIQKEAIQSTQDKLKSSKNYKNVRLVHSSHEHLTNRIPTSFHKKIDIIMFNLGYLPHGNKTITTKTQSSLHAIQQCKELLKPKGILSILAYPGHPEGLIEHNSIKKWLNDQSHYSFAEHKDANNKNSPVLWLLKLST